MCKPSKRGALNRALVFQSERVLSSGYSADRKQDVIARADLEAPSAINPQHARYAGRIPLHVDSALV